MCSTLFAPAMVCREASHSCSMDSQYIFTTPRLITKNKISVTTIIRVFEIKILLFTVLFFISPVLFPVFRKKRNLSCQSFFLDKTCLWTSLKLSFKQHAGNLQNISAVRLTAAGMAQVFLVQIFYILKSSDPLQISAVRPLSSQRKQIRSEALVHICNAAEDCPEKFCCAGR